MKQAVKNFIREMFFDRGSDEISKTKVSVWFGAVVMVLYMNGVINETLVNTLEAFAIAMFGSGVRDVFNKK